MKQLAQTYAEPRNSKQRHAPQTLARQAILVPGELKALAQSFSVD